MQGQGGYQILDYREFTSDNYEKIYNLITTNKMYLIEHFKTDELEEISLFLTAIKNENDITFLYNNKKQTLVYDKIGITNNLNQGGGSSESKYKIFDLGGISNGTSIGSIITSEILDAVENDLIIAIKFKYNDNTYTVIPNYINNDLFFYFFERNSNISNGAYGNDYIVVISLLNGQTYISLKNTPRLIKFTATSLEKGSLLELDNVFDLLFLMTLTEINYASITYSQDGQPDQVYNTPMFLYERDSSYVFLLQFYTKIFVCTIGGYGLSIIDYLPLIKTIYNTLQVSGIESIAVNSSITTSIQSLTGKNTTITSIKPSVAGVIVSAPYFDETDNCYKTTIFNATTSAVSDLTLTIDYYTLTQD